jgi:hypothetical protein
MRMMSHARVEAAGVAVGGSGLNWQGTKGGQRFETPSSRQSNRKNMA